MSSSSGDSTPPAKKQRKQRQSHPGRHDKRSAGAVIGDAISKLVDVEASKSQAKDESHQRVALAIESLMENYDNLDGITIATLADLMAIGFNATIFLSLRGIARDAWVQKNST